MDMATLQDQNPKNDGITLDAPIKTLNQQEIKRKILSPIKNTQIPK